MVILPLHKASACISDIYELCNEHFLKNFLTNFNAFEEQKFHSISQLVVKWLWFPGQTEGYMTEFNCWTVQPLLPLNFQGLGLTWGGLPVWDEQLLLKDYFHKLFTIYALPVPTPIHCYVYGTGAVSAVPHVALRRFLRAISNPSASAPGAAWASSLPWSWWRQS